MSENLNLESRLYSWTDLAKKEKFHPGIIEKDIHEIAKWVAPEEQVGNYYSEKFYNDFHHYCDQYFAKTETVEDCLKRAQKEVSLSIRFENLQDRSNFYKEQSEKLYASIDSSSHYSQILDRFQAIERDFDHSEYLIDSLISGKYSGTIEEYNQIEETIYCLDDVEENLDKISQILQNDIQKNWTSLDQTDVGFIHIATAKQEKTIGTSESGFQKNPEFEDEPIDEDIYNEKTIHHITSIGNGNDVPLSGFAQSRRDAAANQQSRIVKENAEFGNIEEERDIIKELPTQTQTKSHLADSRKEEKERLGSRVNNREENYTRTRSGRDNSITSIWDNREVRNAGRSIGKSFREVSEINKTQASEGYNKIRPAKEAVVGISLLAAGRIANQKALEEVRKVDFSNIEKNFRNSGIINSGSRIQMNSLKDKDEFIKQARDYFAKDGIRMPKIRDEQSLRAWINTGNLTTDQKQVAEALLKVGKMGAGQNLISRGTRNIKRASKQTIGRMTDDNDSITGLMMVNDIGRNARMAYKAYSGIARKAGNIGKSTVKMASRLTEYVADTVKEGAKASTALINRSKLRINTRPKTMKAAREVANVVHTVGTGTAATATTTAAATTAASGTAAVVGAVTGGAGLTYSVKGALGVFRAKRAGFVNGLKTAFSSPKSFVLKITEGVLTLITFGSHGIIGALLSACVTCTVIFTCLGCILAFFVAMFAYTNDAFSTSDRILENIGNFFDIIRLDGNETNEDTDGLEARTKDSVGYAALENVADFYTKYEDVVHQGIMRFVKERRNDCQDISEVFTENPDDAVGAKEFLYNDIEGNETLNTLFSTTKGMKNIKPITYYITSNYIIQAMDGTIGSEYPYWNASEILAMSSVRYSNSINPYNYRRYNRSLRYQAYACDVSVVQSAANWFKDVTNLFDTNTDWGTAGGVYIDEDQIFVSDPIYSGVLDPNYNDKEIVYIGFTDLSNDDMNVLTKDRHIEEWTRGTTEEGEYDEEHEKELNDTWKEEYLDTYLCDHYEETPEHETWTEEHPDSDGDGTHEVTYTRYGYTITCKGHHLAQAYVRCATLSGLGNLYQVDDENGNNKTWMQSLIDKIFPQEYNQWKEADQRRPNKAAVEAKTEVSEMLTENWETTYDYSWAEVFPTPEDFNTYGAQLSQGNATTKDAAGNKTALGWAKEYIEQQLEKIKSGEITDPEMRRRIEIIDAAVSYAGRIKYYYGANDVKNGISDCSAFISDAMGIGRTTTADIMGWSHKSLGSLKPGDLICKDGHVRMFICKLSSGSGERYLTVENTSGSSQTNYVHGCSCALYSAGELSGDGYVGIDISNKISY